MVENVRLGHVTAEYRPEWVAVAVLEPVKEARDEVSQKPRGDDLEEDKERVHNSNPDLYARSQRRLDRSLAAMRWRNSVIQFGETTSSKLSRSENRATMRPSRATS